MTTLVEGLRRRFDFSDSPQRDFSIELDPRFIDTHDVAMLARLGFNRASLGVQDFDPQVQESINRVQGVQQTLDILRACRDSGMRSVNVDLIYGLPGQSLQGFGRTLEQVLALRPDRLAVYGYAHLPHLFRAQKQIDERRLPSPEDKLALLGLAVEKLSPQATSTSAWIILRCRKKISRARSVPASCIATSWAIPPMPTPICWAWA